MWIMNKYILHVCANMHIKHIRENYIDTKPGPEHSPAGSN